MQRGDKHDRHTWLNAAVSLASPGFPPADMLESMWGMMRLSPFGSAFSGAQPGAGLDHRCR